MRTRCDVPEPSSARQGTKQESWRYFWQSLLDALYHLTIFDSWFIFCNLCLGSHHDPSYCFWSLYVYSCYVRSLNELMFEGKATTLIGRTSKSWFRTCKRSGGDCLGLWQEEGKDITSIDVFVQEKTQMQQQSQWPLCNPRIQSGMNWNADACQLVKAWKFQRWKYLPCTRSQCTVLFNTIQFKGKTKENGVFRGSF